MRVLQVGNLYSDTGGPALSMYLTMKGLERCGVNVEAYCPQPFLGQKPIANDVNVRIATKDRIPLGGYEYIPKAMHDLHEMGEFDIIHVQGGWTDIYDKAARYARKKGIPYIMTPRGGLYPQALSSSSWKKTLAMRLFFDKDYKEAACVQCTCEEEYEHYRRLGYMNPVAIIPNSFDTKLVKEVEIPLKNKTIFGYLGRLHPRKRVERLIYSFADYRELFNSCELRIIGSDVIEYEQFLKNEVKRLRLTNVFFTGFLSGEEKDKAIRSLSCLVLPSDYENFGNVVVEALARGVPTIVTKGAPWGILEEYKCGMWINNDQSTITESMMSFAMKSHNEQRIMGYNGQRLVEDKYSVEIVGKQMKDLYEWIIGESKKPSFVLLHNT